MAELGPHRCLNWVLIKARIKVRGQRAIYKACWGQLSQKENWMPGFIAASTAFPQNSLCPIEQKVNPKTFKDRNVQNLALGLNIKIPPIPRHSRYGCLPVLRGKGKWISMSLRAAWSTYWVQPEPHNETPSGNNSNNNEVPFIDEKIDELDFTEIKFSICVL